MNTPTRSTDVERSIWIATYGAAFALTQDAPVSRYRADRAVEEFRSMASVGPFVSELRAPACSCGSVANAGGLVDGRAVCTSCFDRLTRHLWTDS